MNGIMIPLKTNKYFNLLMEENSNETYHKLNRFTYCYRYDTKMVFGKKYF